MTDYVTKNDLDVTIKAQTDEIVGVINVFMAQVDQRFNKIEARMDEFDKKLDKLMNTIDGFI